MTTLKFSIYKNEFVQISSNNEDEKVAKFFKNTFYQTFDMQKTLINLSMFLKNRTNVNQFLAYANIEFEGTDEFIQRMKFSPSYKQEIANDKVSIEEIKIKLSQAGFIRKPNKNQIKNLQKLCSMKACASFSVPGAGKTTEALAFYVYHKKNNSSKLLVLSPINAFISWKDEIKSCLGEDNEIVRLRGTAQHIESLIKLEPQFMIMNYNHFVSSEEKLNLLKDVIINNPDLTIILDESHKIKGELISEIINKLAPYVNFKMILTGTPMPQAPSDLRSQFSFLYPNEYIGTDHDLIDLFEPLYVRTTKENLELKDVIYKTHMIEPYPAFKLFYDEYIVRGLSDGISLEEILTAKSLKDAVLKLIKFFSNPYSCIEDIFKLDPGLAMRIEEEGDGAKIDAVVKRTNELIAQNEKVIIWTSFIKNVEILADEVFKDKAVFIHGGVPTQKNEHEGLDDFDTREARIDKFKNDPRCMILVANPAAAAESISLHEQCNYALYLDRTYNAGQFLQSQDRIHRLIDKSKEQQKYIEVFMLNLPGSIEERVHEALNRKIEAMAKFLDDPSLLSLEGFAYDDDDQKDHNPMDHTDIKEFKKSATR